MSSGANFGIGIGAFSQGLLNGMQAGSMINDMRDKKEIRKASKEGMADAEKMRQADIEGSIKQEGGTLPKGTGVLAPAATGGIAPAPAAKGLDGGLNQYVDGITKDAIAGTKPEPDPGKATFKVGDKSFDDRTAARKYAEDEADPTLTYMRKTVFPKMRDAYMAQGNIEAADKLQTFADDKKQQEILQHWSNGNTALGLGDYDRAAKYLAKGYNAMGGDYAIDGTPTIERDKDGKAIGVQIVLADKEGNKYPQKFKDVEDTLTAFAGAGNPTKLFEMYMKESADAKKARLELAAKREDRANALADKKKEIVFSKEAEAKLKKLEHAHQMELETHKSNLRTNEKNGPNGEGGLPYRKAGAPEDYYKAVEEEIRKNWKTSGLPEKDMDAEINRRVQKLYPGFVPGKPYKAFPGSPAATGDTTEETDDGVPVLR